MEHEHLHNIGNLIWGFHLQTHSIYVVGMTNILLVATVYSTTNQEWLTLYPPVTIIIFHKPIGSYMRSLILRTNTMVRAILLLVSWADTGARGCNGYCSVQGP